MANYELLPNSWKKVYDVYGTVSLKIQISVATSETCSYKFKFGFGWASVTLKSGTFKTFKILSIWNGRLYVKSPVQTYVNAVVVT